MLKDIVLPDYIYSGIKHNALGFPKRLSFFGCDFETVDGEPDIFTACSDNLKPELFFVNRKNVLDKFLAYFEDKILSHQVNIAYFHNLTFDMSVLLINYHEKFLGHITTLIHYKRHRIKVVMGKVCFATITFPSKKTLMLFDSMAFVKGSLEALSEKLKFPVKKMKRPENIGAVKMRDGYSLNYAKRDALCQYYLAKWIMEQHKKYDLRICLSASQYSARIFRHYHIWHGENIQLPYKNIVNACILSYHGGKNGYYLDSPTIVKNCTELDINSAYPYAMYNLPNFFMVYYKKTDKVEREYEGIYKISGEIVLCKYPILYDHEFKKLEGKFKDIWVTSYELKEAIKSKEVKIESVFGYIWIPHKEYKHNPLQSFVDEFWKLKEEAETYEDRTLYKLILNSLYGKFIQTIEIDSDDNYYFPNYEKGIYEKISKKFKAGGLFNPFIATLITGYVRAYLHRLEHKYQSIHSSTDSVKTCLPIDEADLSTGLGGLKKEIEGKCIILRNKLYVHYDKKGEVSKYALHGFTGHIKDLLYVIEHKSRKYKVQRLLKVREALRQKLKPLVMTELEKEVDIDFSQMKII